MNNQAINTTKEVSIQNKAQYLSRTKVVRQILGKATKSVAIV
ncbi:MAG TPA: hypothetical protein ACFYEC_03030 [Candidatus Brocadiaceae bacterium]